MNDPGRGALQRVALMTCVLTAAPLSASASAQSCSNGAISEIIFNRGRPFRPAETAEGAFLGGAFRTLNSVHIASRERTIRWELLFAEEDCFDPLLVRESERNLRNLAYIAEAEVESEQLADGLLKVAGPASRSAK